MIDPKELAHRFAYHKPTGAKIGAHGAVRNKLAEVAVFINLFVPEGREKALAITHLEDAMMWANAGIARHDIDYAVAGYPEEETH